MGLGWACLHVDLAVFTEEKRFTQHKRVTGHVQWCDFWSCYQFFGTGKKDALVGESGGKESGQQLPPLSAATEEFSDVAYPLASWILQKVRIALAIGMVRRR